MPSFRHACADGRCDGVDGNAGLTRGTGGIVDVAKTAGRHRAKGNLAIRGCGAGWEKAGGLEEKVLPVGAEVDDAAGLQLHHAPTALFRFEDLERVDGHRELAGGVGGEGAGASGRVRRRGGLFELDIATTIGRDVQGAVE